MARQPKRQKTVGVFTGNFNRVLRERGLTPKMASELLELPYSTVTDWMNGANPTNFEAIGRFCKKLGVDFSWLMLNEPMQTPNLSQLPIESLFEEKEVGMSGFYKITATRLVPKKKMEDT